MARRGSRAGKQSQAGGRRNRQSRNSGKLQVWCSRHESHEREERACLEEREREGLHASILCTMRSATAVPELLMLPTMVRCR